MSTNDHTFDERDTVDAVEADAEPTPGGTGRSGQSGGSSRRRYRRRRSRALITDAAYTPEQNLQSRERQYAVLQGLRLPFILGAIAAAAAKWWVIAGVLFVISVPLPWIAVVRGNAQGEVRDPREKNVYKPAVARQQQQVLEQQHRAAIESPLQSGSGSPAIIDHDE